MDARSLSSMVLFRSVAKAKRETILGSYLDIHPDWKAFMETSEPRMDGNLKEASAKVAQMGNTEKNVPAARNAIANTQPSDVVDCANDVDKNRIETQSPSKEDEIQAGHDHGFALRNDDKFNPEESNSKGVHVVCKEAGCGNSCEAKFSGLEATEPSSGSHSVSPVHADTDVVKFWYPDNTNTSQEATGPSPCTKAVSPDHADADVVRFPLGQGWAKFWYPDHTASPGKRNAVKLAPSARSSRTPDQQRRIAQSTQPDPLVGMERYHLVVVEKDFSITIQEVGLRPRGLEKTEVAREAAVTNKPPPRTRRKVTFNLDAPEREAGRLRRGWARVSVAARRMFRRCRCCLGQR